MDVFKIREYYKEENEEKTSETNAVSLCPENTAVTPQKTTTTKKQQPHCHDPGLHDVIDLFDISPRDTTANQTLLELDAPVPHNPSGSLPGSRNSNFLGRML